MAKAQEFNASEFEDVPPTTPWWLTTLRMARRKPLAATGAVIVLALVLLAVFADVVIPYDPVEPDFESMLQPPSAQYWLGTDHFGRDILSRLIHGARTALYVGIVAAFFGTAVGLVLGVASAYFGGLFDLYFQRVMDIFVAFPLIIMALAIVSVAGTDMHILIFAISLVFMPNCARILRSNALLVRELPYVDAARACGYGHTRIILRHMVPNVMAPYLVVLTSAIGEAILLEASLSYLGLGVQEPTPAWGAMLQGGAEEYAESAPWIPIFPGLAISLTVFAFSVFGDGLRDILDPRLRTK